MGLLSERSEDDEERGEISIAGLDGLDGGAPDEIVYELDDWSDRDRAVLRDRLETLGVPHTWEGVTLVVAAADDAWVERIMDQVEDDLSVALDPDAPQIAYDLSGWDVDNRERLFAALEDEALPFGVDEDELFVHERDEARVDEMIEGIVTPAEGDDLPAPPAETAPQVMGDLFVAADRLVHDPEDHEGTLSLIDAIRAASPVAPPYGMDKVWWEGVLGHADELVALLDSPSRDDEAISERATALRDGLRPYV
jgi:hypothetical protein